MRRLNPKKWSEENERLAKKSFDRFIEDMEYQHFLDISGRLDAEWFERAGYED